MNILKLAAQILLIYILYRLVVNFVIPTYRSVKRFRKQFHEVQQRMKDQYEKQQQPQQPQNTAQKEMQPKAEGEYIEFEEVKE